MAGSPGPVGGGAGEEAAVLHDAPADVDVTDDLSVDRHVLPHHVPGHHSRKMILNSELNFSKS